MLVLHAQHLQLELCSAEPTTCHTCSQKKGVDIPKKHALWEAVRYDQSITALEALSQS